MKTIRVKINGEWIDIFSNHDIEGVSLVEESEKCEKNMAWKDLKGSINKLKKSMEEYSNHLNQ